jgi:uncharacterized protein (DUF697 family)
METLQQATTTTRHEYRMKSWQKTILVVIGAAGLLGALAILATTFGDSGRSSPLLLAVFIAAFGVFMLSSALRSRLIIDRDHIEVRGAIREQSAESGQITGFRTISSRNGSYTRFYLKDGRGTLTMSNSFAIDDAYRAWLRKIPDLDKIDRDALLSEISQQQELGSTPEERLATLSQAKTSSIFALVVACAAAVALNFGPPILQVPFAIALGLIPVALALMLHRAPLLYSVFKRKSDPRAELCYALIAVSFGFLLRNRGIHLVSLRPLGMLIVFVAFAYFAAFFRASSESSTPMGALFGLLFLAAFYGYAMAITANTVDDHSTAITYTAAVTGKHISSGRSTHYYLELSPWGPMQTRNSLSVSRTLYDEFAPGSQICLRLHDGRLHAPWYAPISCTEPSSDSMQ